MVIFGGLEFVAAGYIGYRYHKNKNEKKRLVEDAQQRRHNSFPGAKPQSYPPQPHAQQQYYQQPPMPQHKYAYYAPQPQQQPQFQPQPQPQPQLQPYIAQPFPPSQSYNIPRRPLPGPTPEFQQQIQPLQRADSMATLSRMPVADGRRYRDDNPSSPPRPELLHVQTMPSQSLNHPYGNSGFGASCPSLEHYSSSPMGHHSSGGYGHTVDDNWETYGGLSPQVHVAPSVSTQLGEEGEDHPPPPYRP